MSQYGAPGDRSDPERSTSGRWRPPPTVVDHPEATTVLVLGILGLVLCQVLGIIAWVKGNRVVAEIDSSGGRYGARSAANAGRICGMVATLLTVGALVLFVLVALLSAGSTSTRAG
ncbi:DUF4190 domain-containing protein [Nocardioides dongxiaopingii]|uniref:DUF4190 domain-containing protein n=1 Tax=Nocardioides TaxID=1839 RepID=UPI0010C76837|nr:MULTISPECIES: DUF4190 domain-containing protein [Nocardioides]QCW51735.1 DUF4190 domain-containing protein [Nocardioides sp. S-1144]